MTSVAPLPAMTRPTEIAMPNFNMADQSHEMSREDKKTNHLLSSASRDPFMQLQNCYIRRTARDTIWANLAAVSTVLNSKPAYWYRALNMALRMHLRRSCNQRLAEYFIKNELLERYELIILTGLDMQLEDERLLPHKTKIMFQPWVDDVEVLMAASDGLATIPELEWQSVSLEGMITLAYFEQCALQRTKQQVALSVVESGVFSVPLQGTLLDYAKGVMPTLIQDFYHLLGREAKMELHRLIEEEEIIEYERAIEAQREFWLEDPSEFTSNKYKDPVWLARRQYLHDSDGRAWKRSNSFGALEAEKAAWRQLADLMGCGQRGRVYVRMWPEQFLEKVPEEIWGAQWLAEREYGLYQMYVLQWQWQIQLASPSPEPATDVGIEPSSQSELASVQSDTIPSQTVTAASSSPEQQLTLWDYYKRYLAFRKAMKEVAGEDSSEST